MFRRTTLTAGLALGVLAMSVAPALAAGPRPALAADDGNDLGFGSGQDGVDVLVDDVITTTIRVANGLPGADGYRMEKVKPRGFLKGGKALAFSGVNNGSNDDGSVSIKLPFQFPFFGIRYSRASVTTNGWVGFGQVAWDYYPDNQSLSDIKNFYRGVFPFWSDLDLDTLAGSSVRRVVKKAAGMVAIQWRTGSHNTGPPNPRRTFQVVLFKNGRIRFDYPGTNAPSEPGDSQEGIIAIGGARGSKTFQPFAIDTLKPPSKSILFTPRKVDADRSGRSTVRTTIPEGDAGMPNPFVSASPKCAETTAATDTSTGLVRCRLPRLEPGTQVILKVRWVATDPGTVDTTTTWPVGGKTITDLERLMV